MKKYLVLGLALVAGLIVHGCGGGTSAVGTADLHTGTYTGAGSVWTWTLNADGNFTAIKKATSASTTEELHINGTYVSLTTGFYKFTVVSSSGTDMGLPTAGDTAFGFAVPGVVLIVKPTGDHSETLVMPVLATACPAFPLSFNWVDASIKEHNGGLQNAEVGGNATVPANATGVLTGVRWTLDGTPGAMGNPPTFTGCSGGKVNFSGGFVSMTSAGVGVVNIEGGGGDIIAFPRDTSVTAATISNKNYVGLVFNGGDDGGQGRTRPINVTFDAAGAGTYTMLSNVETGATSETGPVEIQQVGTGEQAGFLRLRANATGTGADTSPPTMWAAVATLEGHVAFFAAGWNRNADASAVAGDSFSVIAVQR